MRSRTTPIETLSIFIRLPRLAAHQDILPGLHMLVYEAYPGGQVGLEAHALLIKDGYVHVMTALRQLRPDVLLLHVKYSSYI